MFPTDKSQNNAKALLYYLQDWRPNEIVILNFWDSRQDPDLNKYLYLSIW